MTRDINGHPKNGKGKDILSKFGAQGVGGGGRKKRIGEMEAEENMRAQEG